MNKDQAKGTTKEITGNIKEVVGDLTGNKSLKYKGKAEKISGQVQAGYGDAKEKLKKDK